MAIVRHNPTATSLTTPAHSAALRAVFDGIARSVLCTCCRRVLRDGHRSTWLSLTGLLLAGWGIFNVVEGLINHQLLGIHHVRDDIGSPMSSA